MAHRFHSPPDPAKARLIVEEKVREAKLRSITTFFEYELKMSPTRKFARSIRYSTCIECGPSSKDSEKFAVYEADGTYKCYRCGAHGDIVKAAKVMNGYDRVIDAARYVLGEIEGSSGVREYRRMLTPEETQAEIRRQQALKELIPRLCRVAVDHARHRSTQSIWTYLIERRGLSKATIEKLIDIEMIGMLPSNFAMASKLILENFGRDWLITAGLMNPEKEHPWWAGRPLLAFVPGLTGVETRLGRDVKPPDPNNPKAYAERKTMHLGEMVYPWFWKGWIDLASSVELGCVDNIVALHGASHWEVENFQMLMRHQGIRHFTIGLDNDFDQHDNPGQTAALAMKAAFIEHGIPHTHWIPPAKDLNDLLRSRKGIVV